MGLSESLNLCCFPRITRRTFLIHLVFRLHCSCLLAISMAGGWCNATAGATVVIANRTSESVGFTLTAGKGVGLPVAVSAGDVVAIPTDGTLTLRFNQAGLQTGFQLAPNSAHFCSKPGGNLGLFEIGFSPEQALPPTAARWARRFGHPGEPAAIPVKLLVDDDEPVRQHIWEDRLRQRIAAASEIFEKAVNVKFDVVAVGTWESNDRITDFHQSLREFEKHVDPSPARLAIGFTSQYQLVTGRTHLGGTRGPLKRHVMIREWARHTSVSERLEVLVHELGHFLGATHSPEPNSVMRPVLADHRVHSANFRLGFDPVNTLIMSLVAEGIRGRAVTRLDDLPSETRLRLREIYTEVGKTVPDDPAAGILVSMLDRTGATVVAHGARRVVQEVVRTAEINQQLPRAENAAAEEPSRYEADELTGLYFRQGARVARKINDERAWSAYVIGMAIALDRTGSLGKAGIMPQVRRVYETIESEPERQYRVKVLGTPTIHGRYDLTQHFAVSAGLSVLAGPKNAETIGLFKELADSRGTSGFSFADLAANMAGLELAQRLRNSELDLDTLANKFTVSRFLPEVNDLPEGLTWKEFASTYGSSTDDRFDRLQSKIRERISALPGYGGAQLSATSKQ